jgi:hypothetical protein
MKRSFFYLAIVTAAALLVLLVFSPMGEAPENYTADALLLPEFAAQINAVNRVEIISAGANPVATLLKTPDGWQSEQMDGYSANWPKLQTLLAALATSHVVEIKTDKPQYYARLGVEDIEHPDAGGVLVKLGIDDRSTGILVGNQAQNRTGQYVRIQDAKASAMVDQKIDVSMSPLDWLDTSIIDINPSEVAEVELIHADKQTIFITRISADQTDFDLVGMALEREIKSSWAVNSLASIFSMLDMESVRREVEVDWSTATKIRLLTFSGIEIIADTIEFEGEYLFRLQASQPSMADFRQSSATETNTGDSAIEEQAASEIEQKVNDINQKTSGWLYIIPQQKHAAMSKKPEDLLKPVESP